MEADSPAASSSSSRGIELAESSGGEWLWSLSFPSPGAVEGGVRITGLAARSDEAGTTLFACDDEGNLVCIREEEGKPRVAWTRHLERPLRQVHLALDETHVRLAHASGFLLLARADGSVSASLDVTGIRGPGVRFGERVLLGRADGRPFHAVDVATGREWFGPRLNGKKLGPPLVLAERRPELVLVTDEERGHLRAYEEAAYFESPLGSPRWFTDLGREILLGPIETKDREGRVGFALLTEGPTLHGLDLDRGVPRYRVAIDLRQPRELVALGPFVICAGERGTQVFESGGGRLVFRSSGWSAPLVWDDGVLWLERGQVLQRLVLALDGDEPRIEEEDALRLPGGVGTWRFHGIRGTSKLFYATRSGELGVVDLRPE